MAVEMIGGPRLCEPLLATGLGLFTGREQARYGLGKEHLPIGEAVGFQAHRNAHDKPLGTTSQPCASLPRGILALIN